MGSATDWLAGRLSELALGYETQTGAEAGTSPYQVGRRIPPALAAPMGLSWTLVVPRQSGAVAGDTIVPAPHTGVVRLAIRVVDGLDTILLVRPDGYLAADHVPADPDAVLAGLAGYALGERPATPGA